MSRMPPRLRSSFSSSRLEQQRFLLGHGLEVAGRSHALVELLQALTRL
jgi:hypothetical protein